MAVIGPWGAAEWPPQGTRKPAGAAAVEHHGVRPLLRRKRSSCIGPDLHRLSCDKRGQLKQGTGVLGQQMHAPYVAGDNSFVLHIDHTYWSSLPCQCCCEAG